MRADHVDPDTAVKGKEPIATLARHRSWDGATWFGMNLVPDTPGATIRVGDDVRDPRLGARTRRPAALVLGSG